MRQVNKPAKLVCLRSRSPTTLAALHSGVPALVTVCRTVQNGLEWFAGQSGLLAAFKFRFEFADAVFGG
jgi:hypothetical protein